MSVTVPQRLQLLEEENDKLRERIAWMEQHLLGGGIPIPVEWGLSPAEARVVQVLAARDGVVTKEAVMVALYSDRPNDEPEIKIVDVFICKARKKLEPHGVTIETVWGVGYVLDAATRAMLKPLPPVEVPS